MAFVCLCEGVPERDVVVAIERGATDVNAVGRMCGAGTNCHGCHGTIEDMLDEAGVGCAATRFGSNVYAFPTRKATG